MAATYTEVTLDDMERFLKRGWRALRPHKDVSRGETFFDLKLSPNVVIRVWTSIFHGGSSAGVGQDAIRIQLLSSKLNRPLMKGKAPIVKRTQNWRNSLQDRIEDAIETYEEKEDYWEARATGETPVARGELEREEVKSEPPPPSYPRRDLSATFTKLRDGSWGMRIQGEAGPGDRVVTTRQDGRSQVLTVGEVVWQGRDRATGSTITVATISRSRHATDGTEEFEEDLFDG